jgi:hypothetical protein
LLSQVQAEAIAQYIPYVIGMNQAIGDKAAIEFAVGFYHTSECIPQNHNSKTGLLVLHFYCVDIWNRESTTSH